MLKGDLNLEEKIPQRTSSRLSSSLWQRTMRVNWALVIGVSVLILILALAITGSSIAPRNPMETNAIIRVGDEWIKPPFGALEVDGFPLGTDHSGRDLFSRLLWAIRPTMVMVAIVAGVRLVLGTLIGLGSGWSNGWLGRILDTLISGALSVPVLIVALGAIAALGADLGLTAFIIGLSLTGWADTAQLVREQTRIIKGKLYIEAARALGQADQKILFRHVLRQLVPMVWMLLAFEVSSTMMITAGLSFLGYYIGGDIWVDVDDWVAKRISGEPELGEMLAIASHNRLSHPGPLVAVGSAIFIIVFGFTMLGQGLRTQLSFSRIHRRSWFAKISSRAQDLAEQRLLPTISGWNWKQSALASTLCLTVLLVVLGVMWQQTQAAAEQNAKSTSLAIPGDHVWASDRHDPYSTRWVVGAGPDAPDLAWVFQDPAGFSGGPAIANNGDLYIASNSGRLYSIATDGSFWRVTLPAPAVGAPSLDAEGNVHITDKAGGLSAFAPGGEPLWRFEPPEAKIPLCGPMIAPEGNIYYPAGNNMLAVSPQGELLWKSQAPFAYRESPPHTKRQGRLYILGRTGL